MSIDAVNKFWEKVTSDHAMQKAFIAATQARTVTFAAEHNFKFTVAELQTVAAEFKARTDALREELNALREEDLEAVVGGTAAVAAKNSMTNTTTDKIYNRFGEVFDAINISQSGGG